MALMSVRTVSELEGLFVLAPERYDPRRGSLAASAGRSVPLRKLVGTVRNTVTGPEEPGRRCLVLDTSDAREGIIVFRKEPMLVGEIGSAKKVIEPNDVIISRLRPYLRQVAFVDAAVGERSRGGLILCSTEFFVLRPVDDQSIVFLVPFLLSAPVQKVLVASQEGGHHPRFNEATLLGLPVPRSFVKEREAISKAVEESIRLFRESEAGMNALVERAEAALGGRNASVGEGIIDGASAEGQA
jgi:hypothetical protein